ncbi:MAG TPA: methyl-accepting chemotaxis protein, partial [Bradyrhizobium sp.]
MKINRIGNKLGLAGAVGILLSIGMLANQIYTEATTSEVSYRAEHAQMVAEHVLKAQTQLRQVQLNARDIRFARNPADLDKSLAEMRKAVAAEANESDAAYASATKLDTRERLQKLKELTGRYVGGIEELAKAQQALLAQI